MKNLMRIIFIFVFSAFIVLLHSCKKEKEPTMPVLTTANVSGINRTSAISGGNITSDGGSEVTVRGVCWATTHNPVTGSNYTTEGTGTGVFTSNITGLTANITYFVRAYATNSIGTAYGNEVTFSTNPVQPASLTTSTITYFTIVSFQVEGTINDDGGATITDMGFCWDTKTNPTIASNHKSKELGNFPSFLTSIGRLMPNTTYYVRAYATNTAGTAYGNEVSFTTRSLEGFNFNADLTYGSVSDAEGNDYKTIRIGTQTWMAENLRTTRYDNGDLIGTTIPDSLNIYQENEPKYQWAYEGNESLVTVYGRLYTWYAIKDSRNVCPAGWHVPTVAEWTTLTDFLGGESIAGGKLKENGFTHWYEWTDPNPATNESGFTALPGGYRYNGGVFYSISYEGFWWSSDGFDPEGGWGRNISYGTNNINAFGEYAKSGYSIRCVKD